MTVDYSLLGNIWAVCSTFCSSLEAVAPDERRLKIRD
jgi:hypothetical protein